jgi:hypothetical protein
MQPYSNAARALRSAALGLMAAALLGALAGCSEYLDRRDGITLNGGNAVMTNRVTQMVDPWPHASANRNIAFNGERMEAAFTRYRTGKVIQPAGIGTGNTYQAPPPAAAPANTTPVGPTVTAAPTN